MSGESDKPSYVSQISGPAPDPEGEAARRAAAARIEAQLRQAADEAVVKLPENVQQAVWAGAAALTGLEIVFKGARIGAFQNRANSYAIQLATFLGDRADDA